MARLGGSQRGQLLVSPTHGCTGNRFPGGIQNFASDEDSPFEQGPTPFRDPVTFCRIPGEAGVSEAFQDRSQLQVCGAGNDPDRGLTVR